MTGNDQSTVQSRRRDPDNNNNNNPICKAPECHKDFRGARWLIGWTLGEYLLVNHYKNLDKTRFNSIFNTNNM